MPSEKPARRLVDIIEKLQAIFRYTESLDLAAFEKNRLVHDAVERGLERISEAMTKLGDRASVLLPNQPWYKIGAFGNILRHEYDNIVEDRLWEFVKNDLPSLLEECETALRKLQGNSERS